MRMNTPPREELFDSSGDDFIGELDDIVIMDSDEEGSDWEQNSNESDTEQPEEVHPDMATFVFSKHQGSVFSCAIAPNKEILASSGEDDLAYLWTPGGDELLTITGHRDSVTHVSFSHDGSLFASGDMSGYIQVFKVSALSKIWEFETGDLNWIFWHSKSNILFAGTTEGEVWMWLITKGDTKSFPSFGVSTQIGSLSKDGKRLAVGYNDGTVNIFDLKTGEKTQSFSDNNGHTQPVVSLSSHKDNSLVLSGSMDGSAKLFNSNNGKVVQSFVCDIADDKESEPSERSTIEVASFCPTISNLAVTATLSGFISIWDISSGNSRHHIVQGCGTSKVVWHPSLPVFYACGLDGILRAYDVRSGELLNKYTGHKKSILDVSIKSDGSKIVTSSDDGTVRIFQSEEKDE